MFSFKSGYENENGVTIFQNLHWYFPYNFDTKMISNNEIQIYIYMKSMPMCENKNKHVVCYFVKKKYNVYLIDNINWTYGV